MKFNSFICFVFSSHNYLNLISTAFQLRSVSVTCVSHNTFAENLEKTSLFLSKMRTIYSISLLIYFSISINLNCTII